MKRRKRLRLRRRRRGRRNCLGLAANDHASEQVRAIASLKLDELKMWFTNAQTIGQEEENAHFSFVVSQIVRFQKDPKQTSVPLPVEPPDGPPIGTDDDWDSWD